MLSLKELGEGEFELVAPSVSILAEPPVAVIDGVVDRKGTREVATAYLEYLYTEKGQEIAAKNYYRPRDQKVAEKYADQFPKLSCLRLMRYSEAGKRHKKPTLMTVENLIQSTSEKMGFIS